MAYGPGVGEENSEVRAAEGERNICFVFLFLFFIFFPFLIFRQLNPLNLKFYQKSFLFQVRNEKEREANL